MKKFLFTTLCLVICFVVFSIVFWWLGVDIVIFNVALSAMCLVPILLTLIARGRGDGTGDFHDSMRSCRSYYPSEIQARQDGKFTRVDGQDNSGPGHYV